MKQREMRLKKREITDPEILREILESCEVVRIGAMDEEGMFIVPMNYGYEYVDGKLTFYLHGATKGYKFDVLEKNPKVSFALETDMIPFEGKVACQYGMAYRSVMGRGYGTLVADVEEKEKALSLLMKQQTGKDFTFDEKLVSIVNVIRIDVKEFTAKERKLPAAMQQDSCK